MRLTVDTKRKREIVDITDEIEKIIFQQTKEEGVVCLFIRHTTAALTTADLDPGTDLDMLDAFEKVIPHLNYRHPHDPSHAPDHILSSLIGTSLTIPFSQKHLELGTWQRIVVVELDGPRKRDVVASIL